MMEQRLILITLLVKLGVAAAVSSALVRSVIFKNLLFLEDRTPRQKFYLTLWIAFPLVLGVWIRFSVKNFLAADLAFETSILIGVMVGRASGVLGGALLALPALLHGEFLALPFNILCGAVAGELRHLTRDRNNIWSFSPFIDLSIYRWVRRNIPHPTADWQVIFFLIVLLLQFVQNQIADAFPGRLFHIEAPNRWIEFLVYLTAPAVIGTALKIWNSVRIQLKLEEQEKLLLQARMDGLKSQINPHFLFNTLNSVSSLVRFDPDRAREMILKLASILRRLLYSTESFVALRDEIEFIDDYLDIEVVRFGPDKLRVSKELEAASLDVMVPSMLLQPFVENSIKHGLANRVEVGNICLRSRLAEHFIVLEVEDDGAGFQAANPVNHTSDPESLPTSSGIGMANVAERLKVLYSGSAILQVESRPGQGTLIRLRLPILSAEDMQALSYDEAASVRR